MLADEFRSLLIGTAKSFVRLREEAPTASQDRNNPTKREFPGSVSAFVPTWFRHGSSASLSPSNRAHHPGLSPARPGRAEGPSLFDVSPGEPP